MLVALGLLAPLPSSYAQDGAAKGVPRPTDWSTFAAQLGLPDNLDSAPDIKLVPGDYPHLTVNASPLHLIGWDLGANLQYPQRELIEQIEVAKDAELPVVVIRVDLGSITGVGQRNLNEVKELANAASNHQRWFILAIELDWAPDWYLRSEPGTIQETSPSNLDKDHALGLVGPIGPGPVKQTGRGGQVAMGDGKYLDLCEQVLEDLYWEFGAGKYDRFLGWVLTPPSAPFLYRGVGRDGVSGFGDYSGFTQARFNFERDYWDAMARREAQVPARDILAGDGPFTGTGTPDLGTMDPPAVDEPEALSPTPEAADPLNGEETATTPEEVAAPIIEDDEPTDNGFIPMEPRVDPYAEIEPVDAAAIESDPALLAPNDPNAPDGGFGEPEEEGVVTSFRNAIPDPLPPGSKNGPDTRPIWLKWTQFRQLEQQVAIDTLGRRLRYLDKQHPIFATAWGTLAYRDNNGYEAMTWAADPVWLARRPYIDGLILPFELSSRSFALPSGVGDSDNINALRAMADLAQRYNKVPLVSVERSFDHPPRLADLISLQQWCVASGVDPIWSSNGFFTKNSTWGEEDVRQFARGAPFAALPFPNKKYQPQVTILDSPILLSNNYCDQAPRLERAAYLPDILNAAGVSHRVVYPQEFPITGGKAPDLGLLTFLLLEDLVHPQAFDRFTIGFQTAFQDRQDAAIAADLPVPILDVLDDAQLANWQDNGYGSNPLRYNFTKNLGDLGIRSRLRNGPPTLMEVNDTYVFYRSFRSQSAPELNLVEDQDPANPVPTSSAQYFNFNSASPLTLNLSNGFADFSLIPNSPGEGPVLLGRLDLLASSREAYTQFRRTVIHNQQLSRMRASLPVIFLLTLCTVGLGVLFLYQLNMNRKGGIRLYLLRRRQAAAWSSMKGKQSQKLTGGAKSVRRFKATGNGRKGAGSSTLSSGLRTKK